MFEGKAKNYQLNIAQAVSFNARPAALNTPTGERTPGVVLRSYGRVHAVLPVADALRVANEMADAVEAAERDLK